MDQLWQQLISISSLCLLFFFFLSLKPFKAKNTNNNNSPPSPPKLPIIGNLHQLGALPHRSLASLSHKYGPLMLLKLGQFPTFVVSSPKMAEQVMKTHEIQFSNRPQTKAAKAFLYQCQDVGFAPYGEYWRQARKICALQLFSAKRVESFQFVRDEEADVLVSRIREACVGGEVVNLNQLFLLVSNNNIVSRCVLGEKFEDENGKMSRFGVRSRKLMVLMTKFCVEDFFPCLWWIDVVRGLLDRHLKESFESMDEFCDEVIEEHRVKMRGGDHDQCDEARKDFVDIMLELQRDDILITISPKKTSKQLYWTCLLGEATQQQQVWNLQWQN